MDLNLILGVAIGFGPSLVFIIPFIKNLIQAKKLSKMTDSLIKILDDTDKNADLSISKTDQALRVLATFKDDIIEMFETQQALHSEDYSRYTSEMENSMTNIVNTVNHIVDKTITLIEDLEKRVEDLENGA